MARGTISAWGRVRHATVTAAHRLAHPVLADRWSVERLAWVTRVPVLPAWARRHHRAAFWATPPPPLPERLRTVPGIQRDAAAERDAHERAPLHSFFHVHPEGQRDLVHHGWPYLLPTAPRYVRALAHVTRARRSNKRLDRDDAPRTLEAMTPAERSRAVRREAERLGLSAVGLTAYDPRYAWKEYAPKHEIGSVIVCVYEQDHAHTQTAPSSRAERAAFYAYAEVCERAAALAEFVQGLGGKAQPHGPVGEGIVIAYALAAGLGQLGLNGQLLTPAAGSRVRITLITTNMELEHDAARDLGVHAVCDACRICVKRCPVGAIPQRRGEHRGVTKVKIKTERCFPLVARLEGCAICMKTCPVQRYGLDRVISHLETTGAILGKGTDELEGYRWPLDGRRYGPDEKPVIDTDELIRPDGWVFDPARTLPMAGSPGPL